MAITTYLSTNTLNGDGLNAPITTHKVAEWTRKQDPCACRLREALASERHTRTESRGMEKDIS